MAIGAAATWFIASRDKEENKVEASPVSAPRSGARPAAPSASASASAGAAAAAPTTTHDSVSGLLVSLRTPLTACRDSGFRQLCGVLRNGPS
jgi:hypothetical protein